MAHGVPTFTTQIDIQRDPFLFERSHDRSMRAAFYGGAEWHHERHMPRHFLGFAAAKYGYKKRNKKYNDRKKKITGQTIDNVFTGRSRTEITGKRKIQGTPKSAKLIMKLPISGGTGRILDAAAAARLYAAGKRKSATFTQRQLNSQRLIIERVAEMKAIAADEFRTIARVAKTQYVVEANKPTSKRRIRIK